MKYVLSCIAVISIFITTAYPQKNIVDSLRRELVTLAEDTNKVKLLNKLSRITEDINSDESIEYAEKAIELSKKIGYDEGVADSHISRANMHDNLGNYEEAIKQYRLALEIYERLESKRGIARCYGNMGIVYRHQGKFTKSLEYAEKVLKIFEELGDKQRTASAYNDMAAIHIKQGKYAEATDFLITSTKIKEELGAEGPLAMAYNNLSVMFFYYLKTYEKALDYSQKAVKIYEKTGNKKGLSNCYNSRGSIYEAMDSVDLAINYFTRSIELYSELGNKSGMAQVLGNIAVIWSRKKNPKQSLKSYQEAMDIYREIGDKAGIAQSYFGMANIQSKMGNLGEAEKNAQKGLEIAEEINLRGLIIRLYEVQSAIYEKKGDYAKALESYRKHSELSDSVFNSTNSEKIAEMQTRFETEKKEKENEILKQENEIQELASAKKDVLVASFFGGIILMIAVALALYKRYKDKISANDKLREKNQLIRKQNKNIIDSINYAQRIQRAILPESSDIDRIFPEHFIFYHPRNIVSGDFYWFTHLEGKTIIAAADCTGHGVPGAFMSMIGNTLLNQIINEKGCTQPSTILEQLHLGVVKSLGQSDDPKGEQDGMEMGLCTIDHKKEELEFAGARNPLYVVYDNELEIIKADKKPIGGKPIFDETDSHRIFTNKKLPIKKGMSIYMFSDGYADQKGGPKGKKFFYKPFQNLLVENQTASMEKQGEIVKNNILDWMKDAEQLDDMLVVGVKL